MKQNKQTEPGVMPFNNQSWNILYSLFLSLLKGVIGIIGRSEALVADGLQSLYQSLIFARVYLSDKSGKHESSDNSVFIRFLSWLVLFPLALGTLDVFLFSIIKFIQMYRGYLIEPSGYVLLVSLISIITNLIFLKQSEDEELRERLKRSLFISLLAFMGVVSSRYLWMGGDVLASLLISFLLFKSVVALFHECRSGMQPANFNLRTANRNV